MLERAAAPVHGADDFVEGCGDGEQVPVVDRALLDLGGEPRSTSTQASCRGFGADAGGLARTVTTRSTTWTALRPDAAARACSQARCRQVAEHHFGIGPRDRGVIAPRHHAQVVA